MAGLVCLAPLVIGCLLVNALGVPTLESVIQERPDQTCDPDRRLRDFVSPSRPASRGGEGRTGRAARLRTSGSRSRRSGKGRPSDRQPAANGAPQARCGAGLARAVAPGTPANGTELLRPGCRVEANCGFQTRPTRMPSPRWWTADTASPVRVVYIQAKNKVCIRHIAPGLYDLLAETGENWDPASSSVFKPGGTRWKKRAVSVHRCDRGARHLRTLHRCEFDGRRLPA
jgi:hypothetical protein